METNKIIVEHPNGYKGILYGKRSMIIYKGDTEELHTAHRAVDTADELYNLLATMPELMEAIWSTR